MGSRYGRNKRRANLEKIIELENDVKKLWRRALIAERNVATAREDGMQQLLRMKHLPYVIEKIGDELSREYGPKVAEVAKRVMASDRGGYFCPDLSASVVRADQMVENTVIRGVIPALHYSVQVSNF